MFYCYILLIFVELYVFWLYFNFDISYLLAGDKEEISEHPNFLLATKLCNLHQRAFRLNASVPVCIVRELRVPARHVGVLIGFQGATVKRIQAETGAFIDFPGIDF